MSSIMENVGKKRPRPRRSFTAESKAEIVQLCQQGDRSIGQVAKDSDLTETAVREWAKQADTPHWTASARPPTKPPIRRRPAAAVVATVARPLVRHGPRR